VKLLLDESLQHALAAALTDAGHDVVHVVDLDMHGAPDQDVLAAAAADGRTLITADTDFGTLLALSNAAGPSVVLLRRSGRRTAERAELVLTVIELVAARLERGAVVTVEGSRLRVRELPSAPTADPLETLALDAERLLSAALRSISSSRLGSRNWLADDEAPGPKDARDLHFRVRVSSWTHEAS
jgi:Uncharacterized protein conserved in bacteria